MIAVLKINKLKKFSRFKLFNNFIIAVIMGMFLPLLVQLKGLYMPVTMISIFFILEKLALKTNDWFDKKFNLPEIFKMSILINILYLFIIPFYWINKYVLTYGLSLLTVMEIAIFTIYKIKFSVFLSEQDIEEFKEYQKLSNAVFAEGIILGSLITTILGIFNKENSIIFIIVIICFVFYNIRLLKNKNIFDKLKEY